jgi:two-component system sensor histidine kinase VicK
MMKNTQPDYSSLFKQTPAAIAVITGPTYLFEYVNEAYTRLIGKTDLIGKAVEKALPEVREQGFIELLDGVYSSGKPYIGNEVAVTLNTGVDHEPETSYVNFIYQPIKDDHGRTTGIFAHVTDVSELVRARILTEKLKIEAEEQAAKYDTVLNALQDHVYYFGLDGTFEYGNKAVLEPFGMKKPSELVGKSLADLFEKSLATKLAKDVQMVIKTKKSITSAADYIDAYEVHNYYEYIFSPVYDAKGNVTIVAGLSRNITERRLTDTLRAETVNLKAQRNALAALNIAKDEFISVASHQLRTPATTVKQYLSMILAGYAGDIPEAVRKYLKTAYESNERQLTVINDLLKTAQIDSDIFTLDTGFYDASQLVQEAVDEFMPTAALRRQTIYYTQHETCALHVDASEIKLAVENLIGNASKYSPVGSSITITVSQTKAYVHISIQDEGVGIAKENRRKIFDKFTRLDNKLSDTVTGTGLGLYFVKRVVDLHGGTIKVTSELNKGTLFTICLPR